MSEVTLIHKPTNIKVTMSERKQSSNKRIARLILEDRVTNYYHDLEHKLTNEQRRIFVGSGMRGDKIRTYREQDNTVINHITSEKYRLSEVLKGNIL